MNFDDFLKFNDISLHYANLPCYTKGFAYYNGIRYLVILNNRCSTVQQNETLKHELIHIFEDHFSCAQKYEEECEKHVHDIIHNLKTYTLHFIS